MEIVTATHGHVRKIVEVWREFIDYHKSIDPFFERRPDAHQDFEKLVHGLIDEDRSMVLVAVEDDKVVGYTIASIVRYPPVFKTDVYGFIQDMAVKGDFRRQGIGEALLDRDIKWFRDLGIERIELRVASRNEIGYSFWKKHGFKDYIHILCLTPGNE